MPSTSFSESSKQISAAIDRKIAIFAKAQAIREDIHFGQYST